MTSPPPTLRLLLPLVAGIALGKAIPLVAPAILLIGLAAIVAISYGCLGGRLPRRDVCFPLCVCLFCIVLGCTICQRRLRTVTAPPLKVNTCYVGSVQEPPYPTERSFRCVVRSLNHDYTIYFLKDSLRRSSGQALSVPPAMGDRIVFRPHMRHGRTFVAVRGWKRLGSVPPTFRQRALRLREDIIGMYARWGVSPANLPIVSALTVGHRGALSVGQRDEFASAGIAHVLALSGLHVGFVWILLQCLLWPLRWHGHLRWLRWLVATVSLWLFALVGGLAPSVVRAVLMCSFMELGLLCRRRVFSVSTISLSALVMLLYDPLYLFNVSFQLSFVAVVWIVAVVPWACRRWEPSNRLLRWVWCATLVSVSAQLGTAPLAMHYFQSCPPYFLLANLAAAVLVPLIVYGVACCLVWPGIAVVVDVLVTLLRGVAGTVGRLPYASVDTGEVGWPLTLLMYLTLVSLLVYLRLRRPLWFILFLGSMTGVLVLVWIL